VTPLPALKAIRDVAREHQLPVHMDGARLWNASVATGTDIADFAACADTVMVSFSKGLGAPVGAVLAGSSAAMEHAWETRKRFGGGMRQSGILAAAALHAIERHWPRMHEDHERARELAAAVDGAGGARVVPPDTNILMIDLPAGRSATDVAARCAERGVRISAWNASRVRAVTHLDVDKAAVRRAGEVLAAVLGG
jgi:threonine aldolase